MEGDTGHGLEEFPNDRLRKFSETLESGKSLEESGYRVTTPGHEASMRSMQKNEVEHNGVAPSQPERVWLCCEGEENFHLLESSEKPRPVRWGHGRSERYWDHEIPILASSMTARAASLIHPTHTLQPGECVEVPPRDDDIPEWWKQQFRAGVAESKRIAEQCERERAECAKRRAIHEAEQHAASQPVPESPETEGPRWEYETKPTERFVVQHGHNDMYCGGSPPRYTKRVVKDGVGLPRTLDDPISIADPDARAAHLAARARIKELGLDKPASVYLGQNSDAESWAEHKNAALADSLFGLNPVKTTTPDPVTDRSLAVYVGSTRYWLGHDGERETLWERRGIEDAVCWDIENLSQHTPADQRAVDAIWAMEVLRDGPAVYRPPVAESGPRWPLFRLEAITEANRIIADRCRETLKLLGDNL